jgi:hypothetical protein
VHVIVFEDLKADPAATFRGLLEFLDVASDYRPPEFAVHNRRHRPRPMVRALMDSRPVRFASERVLPAFIGDARRARLAQRFRQSRVARTQVEPAPIAPDIRAALESELASDVARLSTMLGRDLSALWFRG